MHQKKGDTNGSNVMRATHFEDVPKAHNGRIPGGNITRPHIVIHTQVKSNMNFREVWMAGDIKFSWESEGNRQINLQPPVTLLKFYINKKEKNEAKNHFSEKCSILNSVSYSKFKCVLSTQINSSIYFWATLQDKL